MYNVWVSLLEAEACGYGPGLSDVKHMQLPKILAKNDVREHNEPLSHPINPPIPGPDIAYRRLELAG